MKARDLMTHRHLWVCVDSSDCREAAEMMAEHEVGVVPVLDGRGRVVGVVTDRDICCRVVAQGRPPETPIRDAMSRDLHAVSPDDDLPTVEAVMRRHRVRRIVVIDSDRKLQGMISLADLTQHLHGARYEHEITELLERISRPF